MNNKRIENSNKTHTQKEKQVSKIKLHNKDKRFSKKTKNSKFNYLALILFSVLVALLGLLNVNLNSDLTFLYYFGLFFFIAGYYTIMSDEDKTVIFLFSHGMLGLGVMLIPLISEIINTPLLSDSPINIYIYLGIVILLIITATTLSVIYKLSNRFKEKALLKIIPLIIYLIAIIMVDILPHIYTIIYNITLH